MIPRRLHTSVQSCDMSILHVQQSDGAGSIWRCPSSRCLEQKWLWGRALVQLIQRVLITFPILSLLPFYYSVPNSDPKIKTYLSILQLDAEVSDHRYQLPLCVLREGFDRQLKSSFSLSFPSLYSLLACFLLWLWEVINLRFAIELGHLVRLLCAAGILPFTLSQCHTSNDTVQGDGRVYEKHPQDFLQSRSKNRSVRPFHSYDSWQDKPQHPTGESFPASLRGAVLLQVPATVGEATLPSWSLAPAAVTHLGSAILPPPCLAGGRPLTSQAEQRCRCTGHRRGRRKN